MIYFLSDFHLGAPDYAKSLVREKKVVAFMDSVKNSATEIYLMGDVFDFWFEYKYKYIIFAGFTKLPCANPLQFLFLVFIYILFTFTLRGRRKSNE